MEKGITVLTGANGVGKTSILEAISILGSLRSFRPGKNQDFIRNGSEASKIEAHVENDGLQDTIAVEIDSKRKRVTLNKKAISKRRHTLKILPYIIFSPNDHRIVDGDPSDRRQFINRAISAVDFDYADTLQAFQKVLLHRNRFLKRHRECFLDVENMGKELEVWDEQFIKLAVELIYRRNSYLQILIPELNQYYASISGNIHKLDIGYHCCGLPSEEGILQNIEEFLSHSLKESLQKDILRGSTSIGPHRDEFQFSIDGNQVRFFGSQGEKRSVVLALRLAEVRVFQNTLNREPILLIDDISSELDRTRRQALVDLLKRGNSQVLMTATELPVDLLNDVQHTFSHWDLNTIGE